MFGEFALLPNTFEINTVGEHVSGHVVSAGASDESHASFRESKREKMMN